MTAFVMLDETSPEGDFLRETLVNLNAIVRLVPQGPNHCALLTRPFANGPNPCFTPNSIVFVAGSLRDLQIKLNAAAA